MKNAVARKYAAAIFDIAQEDGRVANILEELQIFQDTLRKVPALYKALEDKEISRKSKGIIINEIAKALSLSLTVRNSIFLIVEKGRLPFIDSIIESYRMMAEEFERMIYVEVKIADPKFESAFKEKIENVLSAVLKKKVLCESAVDASLIGGAVVRIGDISIDASIAGRLAKMREELL